jgi:uncharacterized RDD family membrane protein YckC
MRWRPPFRPRGSSYEPEAEAQWPNPINIAGRTSAMTKRPLPGIGRRLASLLYESLVVFAVLLVGYLLPQIVLHGFGWGIGGRMQWVHVFALLLLYFVWFWLNGGQTLPMKTWKMRLASADGGSLRPAQALLRYLAAWPSVLFFGAGFLWAVFDRDGQFLHDRIAGTRIEFAEPPTKKA